MSDRLLRLSFFVGEDSNRPKTVEVTWAQLAQQLQSPVITPCTIAPGEHQCAGAKCPHKLGQAWCAAAYPPGLTRGKKNVAAVSVLVIDLDHMSDAQLAAVALALQPYKYIVHATHSDREASVAPDGSPIAEDRCLRAVLALSAPVAGVDWDRFWVAAVEKLALPLADRKGLVGGIDAPTRDASRLFFLPSRQTDRGFLAATNEGAELDVAEILASAAPLETPVENVLPGATSVASAETIQAAALILAAAWPPPRTAAGGGGRHNAFLALAGALATHGWPADAITMLTTAVARLMPACDEKAIADRHPQANDSVAAVSRGAYVTSWGTLATYLTRPEAIDEVRRILNMRDAAELMFDVFASTPAPTPASEAPAAYPSLAAFDAIDLFKTNPNSAVPEVTAEPGTFLHHLQVARQDVARHLSSKPESASAAPLFHSARDLFTMQFPPTAWVVKGLLTQNGVGAILAEAKSTKSWMALDMACSVSSGLNMFGLERFWVPQAMPVAYFFAEDQALSVRNRIRAFAAGRGLPPESMCANLHVQPRGQHLDLTKDEDIARIVASCRALGKIGLLILDPLRDLHSGAENESDDMSEVFAKLRAIGTLLECTVLVVHHSKRASKDKAQDDARPGTDARGSSAIEGALDAIISMRDLRGNGENVFSNNVVTQIKNAKGAGKFPLTLTIRDDADGFAEHATWTIGEDIPAGGSQSFDELVLALLEHMAIAELKKERAQTTELLRKAVHRKYELVAAALIQAERDGFILPNKVGNKLAGWLITDRGRDHVRSANAVPAAAQTPAAPTLPDPRLAGGFGLHPE